MNCILFVSHKINDKIVERYNKLKNDLKDLDYDVIFSHPKDLDIQNFNIEKTFSYENYIVTIKLRKDAPCYVNPGKILENFYLKYSNYDAYYIIEYDVEFSGDWKVLINKCDETNADLIGAHVDEIKNLELKGLKWHYFYWFFNNIEKRDSNKKYYRGCFSTYRITNNALKFICNNKTLLVNYIYEMYLPTILINNGFKYVDLTELNLLGKYGYNITITNDLQMTEKEKLYTCYKL